MITAGRLPAQVAGSGQRPIYFIARADLELVMNRKPGRPRKPAPEPAAAAAPKKTTRKRKGNGG